MELQERFERLPIAAIIASKTNPRRHFDEAYLANLAGSIAEKGVVQPILVRPLDVLKAVGTHPDDAARNGAHFEIVAGECRFRASKQAQQSHIPAIIRELSDEQVLELQLIENLHRRDLTPLEQASGYRALIATNPTKHSAESIATRIGMSPAWVWDRLKLLDLILEVRELLEQDRISVGHAILIARLKADDQRRVIAVNEHSGNAASGLWQQEAAALVWDETQSPKPGPYAGLKPKSIRELDTWINDHIRFDLAHAAKAVPMEFEPLVERVQAANAKPGRGKKVIPISLDSYLQPEARDDNERTYGPQSWKRADGSKKTTRVGSRLADSPACDHAILGVVAAGERRGEAFDVCVAKDRCEVHWKKEITEREKTQKLRESGKGKQAASRERRQQHDWQKEDARREEERKRWDALKPHALEAVAAKIKPSRLTDTIARQVIAIRGTDSLGRVEKLLGGRVTVKTFTRALVILDLVNDSWSLERFKPHAKKYRVDLVKLEKSLEPKA